MLEHPRAPKLVEVIKLAISGELPTDAWLQPTQFSSLLQPTSASCAMAVYPARLLALCLLRPTAAAYGASGASSSGGCTSASYLAAVGNAPRTCITYQGSQRCWYTYVPVGTTALSNAPLIVALHGYGDCPLGIAESFSGVADTYGALVIFPAGSPSTTGGGFWNAAPAGATNKAGDIDDLGFLRALILDTLSTRSDVDSSRVYMTGYSNGCMMASYFVLQNSALVAGLGCLSGHLITRPPAAPAGYVATPSIFVHGTADQVLNVQDAVDTATAFRIYNGCDDSPITGTTSEGYSRVTYTACAAETVYVEMPGVGHGTVSSANVQMIWAFLSAYEAGSGDVASAMASSGGSGGSGGGSGGASPPPPPSTADGGASTTVVFASLGAAVGVAVIFLTIWHLCLRAPDQDMTVPASPLRIESPKAMRPQSPVLSQA